MTIWLQYAGDTLTGNGTDTITSTGFSGAAQTDDNKAVGAPWPGDPWQFEVRVLTAGSSWAFGVRISGYALCYYRDPGELVDESGAVVATGANLADGDVLTISYDGNAGGIVQFKLNDAVIGSAAMGDTFDEAVRGYASLATSGQTIQGVWSWLTHPVAGVDVWDANAPTEKIDGIGPAPLLDVQVNPTFESDLHLIAPAPLLDMGRAPELVLIGPGPVMDLEARQSVSTLALVAPAPLLEMALAPSLDPIAPGPAFEAGVLPAVPIRLAPVAPGPMFDMRVTPGRVVTIDLIGPAPFLEMGRATRLELVAPAPLLEMAARPQTPPRLDLLAPAPALEMVASPSGPLLAFAPIAPVPDGFEVRQALGLDLVAPGPLLGLVVTPNGAFSARALVVNLATAQATRYAGFAYRRMFQAGSRILGVGNEGLEDLFQGEPVAWSFRTAPTVLNAGRVAIVDSVYLDIRSDSAGTATATITYDADHPGDFVAQMPRRADFDIARVKLGKALRGHRADVRLSGDTAVAVRGLSLRLLGKGRKL